MKSKPGKTRIAVPRLGILVLLAAAAASTHAFAAPCPESQAAKPQLRKFVTQGASFVLYLPQGWTCSEKTSGGILSLQVAAPNGLAGAEIEYGPGGGQGGEAEARLVIGRLAARFPGLRLAHPMRSPDRKRIVFDVSYDDPQKGPRESRCWVTSEGGQAMASRIEAPAGKLAANKEMLLSILANARLTKGTIGTGAAPAVALAPHQLRDGSASFSIPRGWRVQDLGKTQFIALDPAGRFSFMVAKADMVSPQMGLKAPGLLVLPFMTPHEASQKLCAQLGIARNMKFTWIERYEAMERSAGQVFTAGSVRIEAFMYTCDGGIGPSKGFSFGMAFYSRVGTWSLNHFSVAGPEAEFDAFAPNFANMLESYRISQAWVGEYIKQGLANLRRLQQETSRVVARNAREIRDMMQAAYEERQTSQDYIDYQRTNYIRGEQDWISSVEGGDVYHSDSWGATNTATGEFYKGQPYDYVHFKGENPKYTETMTAIDSRELWEKNIRNK
jgi:hypothetical protein